MTEGNNQVKSVKARCNWTFITKRGDRAKNIQENQISAKTGQEKGVNQAASVKARCYWAFVAKRVHYATEFTKIFEAYRTRVNDLDAKIQQWVDENEITTVKNEFNSIQKDYENEQKDTLCPNYFSRMRLGERVQKHSDKVKEILDELDAISSIKSTSMTNIVKTRFLTVTVRKLITRIKAKNDPMIGIYGPHGAGKTLIMRLLFQIFEVNTDFKFVIWVTVSKNWTIRKLQDQVLECLSIKKPIYESDEKVAENIFQVLLGKRYVLFLDDVRNRVDYGDLGFPKANIENCCQVILTSINEDIIGTDFDIEVKGLLKKDVTKMIESLPGNDALNTAPLDFISLPRHLKIVAGTLTNLKSSEQIRDYVDKLANCRNISQRSVAQKIYGLSYDCLEETKKGCLTYCINYPECHKIKKSRVGNYMRARISKESSKESLADTHKKMNNMFDDLVKSSWLDECDGGEHVTMPVELRDFLLSAEEKQGESCNERISSNLPANSQSNKSTTIVSLLLQGNKNLKMITEPDFEQVSNLLNLDLSGTSIKSLPDSITGIKSLHSLFLKDCYFLESLPNGLEKLESLEILQVSGAWMPHLPHWIFELKSLKFLKFGYRSIARWWSVPHHMGIGEKNHAIPSGSVCNLSQIEVFNVSNFMYNMRLSNESLSSIAQELGKLEHLSSIHFVFRTIEDLEKFIKNSKPWKENLVKKFRFIVGERKDFHIDIKRHKTYLKYIGGKESGELILPDAILEVLKRSSYFELENHNVIESLSQLGEEATKEVRHCVVKGCVNLTHVINEANIFEKLESLTLSNLPKLETFSSLASLEEVCIRHCPLLTKLLLSSSKLKKIKGSRKWWEALTWDTEKHKLQYEELFVEA